MSLIASIQTKEKFARGQDRVAVRLEKASASLSKTSPRIEEVEVIHKLYLASKEVKMQKEAIINAYLSSPGDNPDMGGLGDGRRREGESAEYTTLSEGV